MSGRTAAFDASLLHIADSHSAPRVLIVGGGLAGLAAASVLAPRGFSVTILESRPRLGGRASSFPDSAGDTLDNCQHVGLGCCTNWLDFCDRVGVGHLLARDPVMVFQDERGRRSRLGPSILPPPGHLSLGFAFARHLTFVDKLRIGWGMFRLMRCKDAPADDSFRNWLLANGQTTRTCDRFWGLVLVSALNESLERCSFRYARQVFVEGFLRHHDAATLVLPRVPLGVLYGEALEGWLETHGVKVHTNEAAVELEFDAAGDMVQHVRTRTSEYSANHVILAVPQNRAADLLPEDLRRQDDVLAHLEKIETSPITSVHLWYDREVLDVPHLVPVGRTTQWLFRREVESNAAGGQYLQAVISASRELSAAGKEEIANRIAAEIEEILPAAREAKLLRRRVVTERTATFSVTPGIDRLRPSQATPWPNLWLAGDYTRTGWPATMEGAVRSGYLAAEGVLAAEGRGEKVLQPPLLAGMLVRGLVRSSDRPERTPAATAAG